MKQDRFIKVIKSMIELSGGSVDKINLEELIELMNDSFIFPWNHWLGVIIQKSPLDLMILQEIMFENRPDTIIECGTGDGGSAYYMASLMDLMKIKGKVITIDHNSNPPVVAHPKKRFITVGGKIIPVDIDVYQASALPKHPKIEYIHSDCLTADIPKLGVKTMVVLDCNHSAEHVYAELEKFSSMVSIGQYIIVEDTVIPDKSNGPAGAVKKFLSKNKHFISDKSREKFVISSNPGGYLLRIS